MKLTTKQLKQIIKEELKKTLNENYTFEWSPDEHAVIATGDSWADQELGFSPEEFMKAIPSDWLDGHMELEVDGGPQTIEIPIEEWKQIIGQMEGSATLNEDEYFGSEGERTGAYTDIGGAYDKIMLIGYKGELLTPEDVLEYARYSDKNPWASTIRHQLRTASEDNSLPPEVQQLAQDALALTNQR